MPERDLKAALAGRLWITGPDGPYSAAQWEAIRRLLVAHVERSVEAMTRCRFR